MTDYNVTIKGRLKASDEQDLNVSKDDLIDAINEEFDNMDIDVEFESDEGDDDTTQYVFALEDVSMEEATDQA